MRSIMRVRDRESISTLDIITCSERIVLNYLQIISIRLRDWSLITGRGGLQNGRGGHVKFYPYEKGGRKKFKPC